MSVLDSTDYVSSAEHRDGVRQAPPDLLSALLDETAALTSLLLVSRKEFEAMGSWRMSELHGLVVEKASAISVLEGATARREATLLAGGLTSLSEAALHHPEVARGREHIIESVDTLRALSRQALEQAGRRLRWVATRRRALSGATVSGGGGTYGPRGDAPRLADGIVLNGRA